MAAKLPVHRMTIEDDQTDSSQEWEDVTESEFSSGTASHSRHSLYSSGKQSSFQTDASLESQYESDYADTSTNTANLENVYTDDFEAPSRPLSARSVTSLTYSNDFESTDASEHGSASHLTNGYQRKQGDNIMRVNSEDEQTSTASSDTASYYSSSAPTSVLRHSSTLSSASGEEREEETSVTARSSSFSEYGTEDDYTDTSLQHGVEKDDDSVDDSQPIQTTFLLNKLQLLRDKSSGSTSKSLQRQPENIAAVQEKGHVVHSRRDRKTEKDYVQQKMRLLRKASTNAADRIAHPHPEPHNPAKVPNADTVEQYGINPSVLPRLQMANTMNAVRKAANTDIHQTRKCPECRKQIALLTEREFVKRHTSAVTSRLVERKLDNMAVTYGDHLGMIHEVQKALPSPQEKPEEIMRRLLLPINQLQSSTT